MGFQAHEKSSIFEGLQARAFAALRALSPFS